MTRNAPARILFLAFLITAAACNAEKKAAPAAAAPAHQRLAADGFRIDIISIDRYVFAEGPMNPGRREMLAGTLDALASRLSVPGSPAFVASGSREIASLAERVRSIPEGPVPDEVKHQWVTIRGNLFTQREWFATSGQHVAPFPSVDPLALDPSSTPGAGSGYTGPGRFDLPGRWRVAEVLVDGERSSSAEFADTAFIFDEDRLTIEGGELAGEYTFIDYIDSKGKALRFEANSRSAKYPNGWMKYGFTEEGRLRLVFFEGFAERPESFGSSSLVSEEVPAAQVAQVPATGDAKVPGTPEGAGKVPERPPASPVNPPKAPVRMPLTELILDPIE